MVFSVHRFGKKIRLLRRGAAPGRRKGYVSGDRLWLFSTVELSPSGRRISQREREREGESERRWVIDYRCMLINGVIGASFWQKNLTFAKGRHAREKKRLC